MGDHIHNYLRYYTFSMTDAQQPFSEHISTEASKVCSADHKNSVTGFLGTRVYIIILYTVGFANFLNITNDDF
jgi:hypothetical protein